MPYGMYPSTYTAQNQFGGNLNYDISEIGRGAQELDQSRKYSGNPLSSYQFKTPGFQRVTDPEFQSTYSQAYNTAARPIRAQGEETMRQATQGFSGRRIGGASQRGLALKQAQATGRNLADVGSNIGTTIAGARLGDIQTSNMQNHAAAASDQLNQANENYHTGGYNDTMARYASESDLQRAQMFMNQGYNWLGAQGNMIGQNINSVAAGINPYMNPILTGQTFGQMG